ncbi:hypothetical protein [Streptomyces sp. NPDC002328]|uniref:hypothetical protein n=1 Tax=Streptomyces sp. NPDC002328 TaxID=3364642 RepID=UPI003676F5F5
MEERSDSKGQDHEEIAELRARAEAGDRNAGGRLGELLARNGDREGALRQWAHTYGDTASTTRRLAEVLAQRGELAAAVQVWRFSDDVWQNPAGFHTEYMATLDPEDRLEEDDPEDWAFMEREQLVNLLARWGDDAAIAELRALAEGGEWLAARKLRELGL